MTPYDPRDPSHYCLAYDAADVALDCGLDPLAAARHALRGRGIDPDGAGPDLHDYLDVGALAAAA
jgi:hypothetical protein